MGILNEWRERLAREQAERRRAQAQREFQQANDEWSSQFEETKTMLAVVRHSKESGFNARDTSPILLKKGEFLVLVLENAGLVEMGRERGTYQGGSQGVSIRITKGVYYRVGGHRGNFVPGPETLKIVDQGTSVITNQRVVFQGAGKTREWLFTKLIGVDHDPGKGVSMLHVSNRQRASGLAYGSDIADDFRFRMDLALAHHSGDLEGLLADLKNEVARLEEDRPIPPRPV
jgi:hypothetical protein